jgi:transglutaminase-like putative cysteine protease
MTRTRPSLRRPPSPEPVLAPRAFDLLCLTMAFVLLVHAPHLPWWLTLSLGVVLVARWRQRRAGGRNAPIWLKLPLVGLLLAAVILTNGTLFGREPGSAFAVGLLVLKLLESERLRDARVGIAFACFALMSALLFDQGLIASVVVSLGLVPALATLRALEEAPSGVVPWRRTFGPVLLALLAAVPLSLFAFLFVPRLSSPLWGTPDSGRASTGLSNRLSPGDMLDLMTDDSPAMRVTFSGPPPPNGSRYFRAYVMQLFDGQAWSPGSRSTRRPPATLEAGQRIAYRASLEPSHERIVPMLDVPTLAPPDAVLRPDHTVLANKRIDEIMTFTALAAPNPRFEAALDEGVRRDNLQLPMGTGPRARELAASWARQYGDDDAAIARAALALFHGDFSYTLAPEPLGRDRIDDFLFQTREGYCEHFSSAFTFLMRAAGIPARVVTGYQGGYWNSTGRYLLVRNSDAHAWSEVWLKGRGWVRFDPTAAVRPERVSLGAAAAAAGHGAADGWLDMPWLRDVRNRWDVVNQWWNRGVIGFDSLRQQGLLQPFGVQQAEVTDLALVFAIGCATLAAISLAWAMFQRREGDALDAWMRRLQRKLAKVGVSRRAGEGPKHFLARAARALPDHRNALERLSELYLRSRYGTDEPPPESVSEFGRAVKELKPRRVVK